MDAQFPSPKTLQEAIVYFADADRLLAAVVAFRWPDGKPTCPACGRQDVRFLATRRIWECKGKHAKRQFSAKVGTIFEDSPIGFDKWFAAMWMLANCKNGISSYELGRAIGITQKSAWFMLQRIRLALQSKAGGKLGGEVEVDETFIGGKARNMHKAKRERVIGKGKTGIVGKIAVMGLLERHSRKIRLKVVPNVQGRTLDPHVRENVERGSTVYTDSHGAYVKLDSEYIHGVVDHAERYVDGQIHTNGLENFWSLLKRSIKGTYVSVEPFHLFRYLDEQAYRFNNRKMTDGERFKQAMADIAGKRLTYRQVTGKEGAARLG